MFKMVVLLVKRDDLTHEEFADYWKTTHAPLVEEMPGVEQYKMSLPKSPEHSAYDGMAELYFEDFEAMKAAYDTDAGDALVADATEFADMDAGETLYLDESVAFEAE